MGGNVFASGSLPGLRKRTPGLEPVLPPPRALPHVLQRRRVVAAGRRYHAAADEQPGLADAQRVALAAQPVGALPRAVPDALPGCRVPRDEEGVAAAGHLLAADPDAARGVADDVAPDSFVAHRVVGCLLYTSPS